MSEAVSLIHQLETNPLTKHWERDYSVFFLSMTAHAHHLANKAELGDGALTLALFTLQKGVCAYYRKTEDNKILFSVVRQKIGKNAETLHRILTSYDRNGREIEIFNKSIATQSTFSIDFLKSFIDTWGELIGYQLFVHRMVDFLEDSSEDKSISQAFSALRIKYEKLFGFFEKTFKELHEKLALQYHIEDPSILSYLTTDEFLDFLERKKLPKDVEKRTQPLVLVTLPGLAIFTGKEAEQIIQAVAENQERSESRLRVGREVQGVTVYGEGSLEAVARVITDYHELASLKEGDVLITPSTLPKYELFYRRARAIVTDEGGMLSHAAIFCREAKKPAIIGTKHATKYIANGAKVTLDFNRGIVSL